MVEDIDAVHRYSNLYPFISTWLQHDSKVSIYIDRQEQQPRICENKIFLKDHVIKETPLTEFFFILSTVKPNENIASIF